MQSPAQTSSPSENLSRVDLESLISADPDVALIIVSIDGQIVTHSDHAPRVFGADPNRNYFGLNIQDIFDRRFVEERLAWLRSVQSESTPQGFRHTYQGDQMVSTIMPIDQDSEKPLFSVLTRRERRRRVSPSASRLIDIEPLRSLSARELEVMILIGHGFSVPKVAKLLHRSIRTIEQHKANIGRKLGGSSLAEISRLVGLFGLRLDDLELDRIEALRPEYRAGE